MLTSISVTPTPQTNTDSNPSVSGVRVSRDPGPRPLFRSEQFSSSTSATNQTGSNLEQFVSFCCLQISLSPFRPFSPATKDHAAAIVHDF